MYFADYHSLLPVLFAKLFKKKSALILAGYGVTYIPELNYGSFANPIRGFCAGYSISNADYLLPVDGSLITEAKEWVQNIKGEIHIIPYGFDPQKWYCDTPKEKIVLTVGNFDTLQRIRRKGGDFFIEVAKLLPEYRFVMVGVTDSGRELLEKIDNVEFIEKVTQDELRKIYSKAKVYAQFSLHEGFPNVVGEAMLCECIPVGSNANGIPTEIGDCGFILENRDPAEAAKLITKAMNSSDNFGKKARERILTNFLPEMREQGFLKVFQSDKKSEVNSK
ncbi:MAG: glycosyltransferase [Calditrichaeota bacterium]|nr:MAG: glycosyltransferase [Calditrichota bacterium]